MLCIQIAYILHFQLSGLKKITDIFCKFQFYTYKICRPPEATPAHGLNWTTIDIRWHFFD